MLFSLLFFFGTAQAALKTCDILTSYKDFYYCSLERHPKLEIAGLKIKEAEATVEKAEQWKNPDLGVKSSSGSRAGESVGSTELELSIPISQLWTRAAQKDIAAAEKKIALIESNEIKFAVEKELIKDLYRFRQLDVELNLILETISTFEEIRRQYKSKMARGPEQEITLNLVELASSDYQLKKNHLVVEKAEILARIRVIWGSDFVLKKELLPPFKDKWPELSKTPSNLNFEVQKNNAENEKAQAEKRLVQRESWPEVSIGPNLVRNTEGPTQYMSYGFNFRMTLPVATLNGGSRKLAESKANYTEVIANWATKKSQNQNEILLQKYNSSVESLKKSSNQTEINKKHQKIDNLFKQGLASGGLVIEAHRQITEFTESQHEHENSAIEAFLEIKTLSAESFEEIFQ